MSNIRYELLDTGPAPFEIVEDYMWKVSDGQ